MSKFSVGAKVKFKGYGQLPDDMDPIFTEGEEVTILTILPDEGYTAENAEGKQDTVYYPDEIDELPAAAAKPSRSRPAKAKAEAEAAPAEEAKPAAPAKPAAKAKATKAAPAKAEAAPVEDTKPAKATKATKPAADAKAAPAVKGGKAKPAKKGGKANLSAAAKGKADAKPAKTKEEPQPIQIVNTEAVDAVLADQDALDAAKALIAQAEETYFTLGGVLAHIYYEGTYKALGYEGKKGFVEYTEKELGVAYRKAMYMIQIYTYFTGLGVDEARLTEIGWSKAKELVNVANDENFDELVDFAKENTREDLIDHIKANFVDAKKGDAEGAKPKGEQVKMVTFKFKAFADQGEIVQRALDHAKGLTGSDDLNVAFAHIVTEWASLTDGVEIAIEDAAKVMETNFNAKVAIYDADGEELYASEGLFDDAAE